jgi:GNAT superfamily N-acetyltransferase
VVASEITKASVDRCRLEELSQLLTILDDEFVFGKGRPLSLAERFPQVFCPANLENIYVARVRKAICAAAAIKRFDWLAHNRTWQGAMIGMVYTRREYRGQGLASRVMRTLQDDLAKVGVDFAVLWTTIPSFYQRLGWFMEDVGIFGEATSLHSLQADISIAPCPLTDEVIHWIDRIHSKLVSDRVARSDLDYRVIPLPASSVDVFLLDETDEIRGYALVGRSDRAGYVYELIGHSATFDQLWGAITNCYGKVYINDRVDTLSSKWLSERATVTWRSHHLTMWLPLSAEAWNTAVGHWYIPYFDRL